MTPFTEGVKKTLMEERQDSKSKRARKRTRNLVAKQNKHRGHRIRSLKEYDRKKFNRDTAFFSNRDTDH